nr:hypothetical protein [Nonomuraea candida]
MLDEGIDGVQGGRAVAEVADQGGHVDGGVAVQGGGVETDGADHAGAGLLLEVLVVDRSVVIEFQVHGVGGERVRNLDGGVDVEGGDVGDHPSEHGHVHRVALLELLGDGHVFDGLGQFLICQGGQVAGLIGDQVDDVLELAVAEEQQVGGVAGLLAGFDAERLEQRGGQASGLLGLESGTAGQPFGELGGDPLGPGGVIQFRGVLGEAGAGGALPRL